MADNKSAPLAVVLTAAGAAAAVYFFWKFASAARVLAAQSFDRNSAPKRLRRRYRRKENNHDTRFASLTPALAAGGPIPEPFPASLSPRFRPLDPSAHRHLPAIFGHQEAVPYVSQKPFIYAMYTPEDAAQRRTERSDCALGQIGG